MSDQLTGIPGIGEVDPGVHICALFSGPVERDRLLVQFMQEGLSHGDRCVCLIDDLEPARTRRTDGAAGLDDMRRSGQLDLHVAPDSYLRAGAMSPRQRIARLVAHVEPSATKRPPLLRAAGQMSHTSTESDAREFFVHESAVILILAELPAVFLCLYDMRRMGVGILADVLKVHSRVLVDGTVLHNPHCVAPHECPEAVAGTGLAVVGGPWRSLTDAEIRIAELVGAGKSNRAAAAELMVSPHTVDAHLKHIYQKLGIHSRTELALLSFRHDSSAA